MRQLLAATVLLALMGLPALYFLRDTPEVRAVAHAVGAGIEDAAETGATNAIVEGMQRVAAGLGASLRGGRPSTGQFSVATIRDQRPGGVSVAIGKRPAGNDAATTGSIKLVAGDGLPTASAASSESGRDVAPVRPDRRSLVNRDPGLGAVDRSAPRRTPVNLAAMNGGNNLSRDYPTSFIWFDLV